MGGGLDTKARLQLIAALVSNLASLIDIPPRHDQEGLGGTGSHATLQWVAGDGYLLSKELHTE